VPTAVNKAVTRLRITLYVIAQKDRRKAVKPFKIFAALIATSLLVGCVKPTISGDAGCAGYGEARAAMPTDLSALDDEWLRWVAATDVRLTAICR